MVRLKNEILYGSAAPDNIGGGRSNLPGDPTGRTAIMLVTHRDIEHMQRIIDAISNVYEVLPGDKQKLVQLKYWKRPQTLTWEGIALEINVSRRQAINWRDEVIYAIARRLGWK